MVNRINDPSDAYFRVNCTELTIAEYLLDNEYSDVLQLIENISWCIRPRSEVFCLIGQIPFLGYQLVADTKLLDLEDHIFNIDAEANVHPSYACTI
jgi:F0F1-type ATP synthase beta subunit